MHFVAFQTPVYPAAPPGSGSSPLRWRLLKFLLSFPAYFAQHMAYVRVLLFLLHILGLRQPMRAAGVNPMRPVGGVLAQHFTR